MTQFKGHRLSRICPLGQGAFYEAALLRKLEGYISDFILKWVVLFIYLFISLVLDLVVMNMDVD